MHVSWSETVLGLRYPTALVSPPLPILSHICQQHKTLPGDYALLKSEHEELMKSHF